MKKSMYDVIVIGGGASGMLAASLCAASGRHTLLLEKNDRCGRKLAITGKGRCNVTNACSAQEVMKNIPRNARFLFSALNAFPPEQVMAFFELHGCPLKIERGNRVFPVSDRAADIIAVLESQMQEHAVVRETALATKLLLRDGAVCGVDCGWRSFEAAHVIVCTGGASYPLTGSNGDGYALVAPLGHTIVPPIGSLVPLTSEDADCLDMQGLSLRNTAFCLLDSRGKAVFKDFGELLFTHFGLSGPMALSASAHLKEGERYTALLDLKPALDEAKLDARILRDLESYSNRCMENAVVDLYPRSMIPCILRRAGIDPALRANSLTKAQRHALLAQTKRFPIAISGTRPVAEAIITRGGVDVREIDPKTMRSKLVRGLSFAGEIIDCDAYTGGFNLQIAWATAYAAAMEIEP
jgi:predicted Rossmann fold flavoprotein